MCLQELAQGFALEMEQYIKQAKKIALIHLVTTQSVLAISLVYSM